MSKNTRVIALYRRRQQCISLAAVWLSKTKKVNEKAMFPFLSLPSTCPLEDARQRRHGQVTILLDSYRQSDRTSWEGDELENSCLVFFFLSPQGTNIWIGVWFEILPALTMDQ